MGRQKPNRKRRVRRPGAVPTFPEGAALRVMKAYDQAVAEGLMAEGEEVRYHLVGEQVLGVALSVSGDVLANGRVLTEEWALELCRRLPTLVSVVSFYADNQAEGRGLDGGPEDGVSMLGNPEAPPVLLHEVHSEAEAHQMTRKLSGPPQPRSPDWREDVLGKDVLTLRPGPNGLVLLEEHKLTEEMCAALRAERPDQAGDFDYAEIRRMARYYARTAPGGLWDVVLTKPGAPCPCGCGTIPRE